MNGVGPWWFPSWARIALSRFSLMFFVTASWDKHDEGYGQGYPSRAECDRKFLQAMLADASQATTTPRIASCCMIAWIFWLFVRLFGWASYRREN